MMTDFCQEKLSAEESDIRPFSDDQNIVIGYACGDERTNYLPVVQWVSGELGRQLFAQFRSNTEFSSIFRPDLKLLASLEARPDDARIDWRHLVLSIQQTAKLPFERQHRILLPILEQILRRMEAGGLLVARAEEVRRDALPTAEVSKPSRLTLRGLGGLKRVRRDALLTTGVPEIAESIKTISSRGIQPFAAIWAG